MTLSSGYKDQFWGDGVSTTFNLTTQFQNASELLVTLLDIDGVTEISRTLVTHYNVTGGAGATGQIIFTAGNIPTGNGAPGSQKITVTRNMPLTQQTDLTPNDPFPADTVERSFGDRVFMVLQQLQEKAARTLSLKVSSSATVTGVDDPVEGNVLTWIGTRLANVTPASINMLTAFYQSALGNISVGRPGSVTAGQKLDVNGNLFVQNMASINTAGDTTGTDSINTYGQVDMYQPNSAMGVPGAVTVPGPSTSSSRGTGLVPVNNLTTELIGAIGQAFAYIGGSYQVCAGIFARAVGATAANLGGALEFWTKADNGILTLRGTWDNAGVLGFVASPTMPTVTAGDSSTKGANTAFVTGGIATAIVAITGYVKTVKKQTFTSSGTYTPSTGMLYCVVEMVGGGGGGAGVAGTVGFSMSGAAGGSGAYSRSYITAATIGASKAVTIGVGGSAGAAGANNGNPGGDTSLGVLVVAKGGGGGGATTSGGQGAGGNGGVGTSGTGDFLAQGAPGNSGNFVIGNVSVPASCGASSALGGGANGAATNATGNTAVGYGGSGCGGSCQNTASTFGGGAGAPGVVIITEYCSQ